MQTAIERIVNAYVQMGNKQALNDLREHREGLKRDMLGRTGFDFSIALGEIEAELIAIEFGQSQLETAQQPVPMLQAAE